MSPTHHDREHCPIRTKPEVCAAGTWRFGVTEEGSMEKEAFELDQQDVEQACSSPGCSRRSKRSGVDKAQFLKARIQGCGGRGSRCGHINEHVLMVVTILLTFLLTAGESFL